MPEARHATAPTSPPAHRRYEAWPNNDRAGGSPASPDDRPKRTWSGALGSQPKSHFREADPKSCEGVSPGLPYMPRWTGGRPSNI